ncbi:MULTISPECIES: serine aminopeptidase domain-containing protein [Bacillaceae]|uniref:serine aminopeptidase domain-containing protein n=1 Tax=Bacillaceae TaxID=186817 RepID=UPI001A8F449B|nr:alpha/beta hydrolase [Bacillus sp. NTK034]MBN8199116.1 alpha/beta hydrolase [Bacillus sp. NTK034]
MESRNFQLDTEWCMIHYPDKPSGFGILIIGDDRHFVDRNCSFWTQNEGKYSLIKKLREDGYTIFYSNLYGRHWGNDQAVDKAKGLYEHILRTEIINEKIHIIAEGMGALVALRLLHEMSDLIRSAVLINPILSLKHHLDQEKEHKFFYKKLLKELAVSYEIETEKIADLLIRHEKNLTTGLKVPVRIIQVLAGGRAYKQSDYLKKRSIQWENENSPISVFYILPDKKQRMSSQMTNFFRKYEKVL